MFAILAAGCEKNDETKEITPPTPPPIGVPDEGTDPDAGVITPDNPNIKVNWVLDFEENFDGTEVNTDDWDMYDSPGHNNNGLRKPEAFTVEDGLLVITAKENEDGEIVSGGMSHKKNYLPVVRFEFKAKDLASDQQLACRRRIGYFRNGHTGSKKAAALLPSLRS